MDLTDKIIGAESGGDPNAKNPNSSASGPSQFIEGTWLDMLAKHRPDLTGSRDELLAMRNDPQLSKDMTAAYAADNAGILKQAGLPVTPGTQYLAHFAGPQGAVGLLNADPTAPAGSILGPGAVKANPFLAKMTAAAVAAWADRKMGGAPLSMAGPPQRQAPAAPLPIAPTPAARAPAQTLQWGGGGQPVPAAPAPTPQALTLLPQRKLYQIPAPFSFRGLA